MAKIAFLPLPSDEVQKLRAGGRDVYGNLPERVKSDGDGNPCRHCLKFVPEGADMLILAYRPFANLQPYAETGPIFLCAENCKPWSGPGVPPVMAAGPDYLLKGYTSDERIRYGTGRVVAKDAVVAYAADLLERADISFVDARSSRNNCFQARIVRAGAEGK